MRPGDIFKEHLLEQTSNYKVKQYLEPKELLCSVPQTSRGADVFSQMEQVNVALENVYCKAVNMFADEECRTNAFPFRLSFELHSFEAVSQPWHLS